MYRGQISPRRVSVLAANLPRGSAVGERLGGAAAITAEAEAGWLIEAALYKIQHAKAGSKGKAPEMREYPAGIAALTEKQDYAVSRAEAFRRKHANN